LVERGVGAVLSHHPQAAAQADHLDLAMARLHENRALPRRGGSGDRDERFLVVDVEGADGKAFLPRPGVEGASGFSMGNEETSFRGRRHDRPRNKVVSRPGLSRRSFLTSYKRPGSVLLRHTIMGPSGSERRVRLSLDVEIDEIDR